MNLRSRPRRIPREYNASSLFAVDLRKAGRTENPGTEKRHDTPLGSAALASRKAIARHTRMNQQWT
jgi:hypothetical protein